MLPVGENELPVVEYQVPVLPVLPVLPVGENELPVENVLSVGVK